MNLGWNEDDNWQVYIIKLNEKPSIFYLRGDGRLLKWAFGKEWLTFPLWVMPIELQE